MSTPVLSIITVCFNACNELQNTVKNVLAQEWTNFEYLVIDGASTDDTVSFLEQSTTLFAAKEIPFHFISEKDHGIYDAMNKGTRIATGDWLLFLNAGDLLYKPDILRKIFESSHSADILYGDTICVYQGQQRKYSALPLKNLIYEMAFCHQSAFISKQLLSKYPYDISFKVCADHYFFLQMYLQKKSFDYLPFPVSIYEIAGFSDKNKLLSHQEKHRMQKQLGVFHFSPIWVFREVNFYFKYFLKILFGQNFINLVRKKRLH